MANEKVTHVTDANFESEVIKSDKPVMIDFWAPWCGPCKAIAPSIDELATEYDGRMKFVKLNVDDNPATAARYGVRSFPPGFWKQEREFISSEPRGGIYISAKQRQSVGRPAERLAPVHMSEGVVKLL